MGVIVLTADAYSRMMKLLLPPGRLWNLDVGSLISDALLGAGDELNRVNQRLADLIEEIDPRTTDELLPEWEALLFGPHEYKLPSGAILQLPADANFWPVDPGLSIAERRGRVVARLVRRRRFRPVDFQQALASLLGQAPADVDVRERSSAYAASVNDPREIYRFFVYRNPAAPGTYDLVAAQALIDEMSPAHTRGYVIESINLLCDDAHSLCDRDLLGI